MPSNIQDFPAHQIVVTRCNAVIDRINPQHVLPKRKRGRAHAPLKLRDAGTINHAHDARGNLQTVRDGRGLTTSFTFNGFGDILTKVSPDTGTTTFSYDALGRLGTEQRANGVTVSYAWDVLDRPISRVSSGGVTETFSYDGGTFGVGRLTRLNDATGTTSYQYSAAGELIAQTTSIVGASYTTGWSYDPAGRLQSMTYPGGMTVGYT